MPIFKNSIINSLTMLRLNSVFKKLALLCVCISCFGNLKANVPLSFTKNAKSVTFKLDKGLMQLNIRQGGYH
jgi:alpha-D-xyloside xylohydrolase